MSLVFFGTSQNDPYSIKHITDEGDIENGDCGIILQKNGDFRIFFKNSPSADHEEPFSNEGNSTLVNLIVPLINPNIMALLNRVVEECQIPQFESAAKG